MLSDTESRSASFSPTGTFPGALFLLPAVSLVARYSPVTRATASDLSRHSGPNSAEPRVPATGREKARALADQLGVVHVLDPFVTPPPRGPRGPVYWRLHGIGGARHSYADGELLRLKAMLEEAPLFSCSPGTA